MSNNNQAAPTSDEARAYLLQNIYAPVFFNKLAAAGIIPANEDEASAMLRVAGKLQSDRYATHVKQAQAGGRINFLREVEGGLDQVLNQQHGVPIPNNYAHHVQQFAKQSAAQLLDHPDVNTALGLVLGG